MAQAFLFNVAERILGKLGSRALQETWLFPGIRTELEKIRHSISTTQAGLHDAESRTDDGPCRYWLGQLKEAMHDTEDLLDDLSAQSLRRWVIPGNKVSREVRLFFSGSNQLVSGLVVPRIIHLRARLERLATDRELFNFEDQLFQGPVRPTEMSWESLPSHLKHCLVCCSLFSKDRKICVPRLINLWIAQGYVKPSDPSQSLEAAGLQHFMDLCQRSFFEEVRGDELGNVVSCTIHNTIHDLAKEVDAKEFVFFSSEDESLIGAEILHAAFSVDPTTPWKVPVCLFGASKLRTFLSSNETQSYLGALRPGCQLEEKQLHLIFSKLGLLRALDLHSSDISRVPSSVCKLKLLAYLDLSDNKKIEVLPDSITTLLLLQILNLDNCEKLRKLPRDTKALVSLIHLGVENCRALTHMPRGIGRLTSLSTLSRFVLPIDRTSSRHGASLCELQNLKGLRGTLRIYNLPHVGGGAVDDLVAAKLSEKKDVRVLRLEWSDGVEDPNDYVANDVGDDKMAMEALQPHLGLERLELKGYRGTEFPSWLSSQTNLVAIALESCEKCQYLPPLHQLSGLKFLTIQGLTALKYVHDGEIGEASSEDFFPLLEKLELSNCPELVGWWTAAPTTSSQLELRRLAHLSIKACPKLSSTSMPVFPSLKSLAIPVSSMRILVPPQVSSSASASSSSSLYLSQLDTLDIEDINGRESSPEELFRNLMSLKTLRVAKCTRLKTLFQGIRHLTSLTALTIEDCQELHFCDGNDGTQWQGLKRLCSLSIDHISELESLPDWIQHLTSLRRLEISSCLNLQSLPGWMRTLCDLQHLIITLCPKLTPRCQRNTGEDWEQIKHIQNIVVNRNIIQGSLKLNH